MSTWSLRKEILLHFGSTLLFFTVVILLKLYFTNIMVLIPMVIGGLIGMFLPDIDHVIYVLFLRPQELTSQRISQKITSKQLVDAVKLLYSTRDERITLIFHTAFFQALFVVFAFLIVTSSGSTLGKGIVLSFLLHLLVDEIHDLRVKNDISRWFTRPMALITDPKHQQWFIYGNALPLLILGLLF